MKSFLRPHTVARTPRAPAASYRRRTFVCAHRAQHQEKEKHSPRSSTMTTRRLSFLAGLLLLATALASFTAFSSSSASSSASTFPSRELSSSVASSRMLLQEASGEGGDGGDTQPDATMEPTVTTPIDGGGADVVGGLPGGDEAPDGLPIQEQVISGPGAWGTTGVLYPQKGKERIGSIVSFLALFFFIQFWLFFSYFFPLFRARRTGAVRDFLVRCVTFLRVSLLRVSFNQFRLHVPRVCSM